MHDRFGRLPFADDFGPAIWIAEHGVPFSPLLGIWFQQSSQILTRLPETKRIFTTEVGDPYKPQDLVSPAGARRHAQKGGEPGRRVLLQRRVGRHFVDAVQREGGKMTLEDLASYQATWSATITTEHS